jgi:uncharacterized protein YprB with RNaseH-like and TPR domain
MIIKEEKNKIPKFQSKALDMYIGNSTLAVFDIETTGLYANRDRIILSGILFADGDECTITQYFAERPDDEASVITATIKSLSKADCIMTYNGRSFDMPFLETRARKHGIPMDLKYCSFDLYTIARGYSELKKTLGSLSQKSVENFMSLSDSRDDEINGYQSVQLYERYLASKSHELENKILLHNHDDVVQLYKLLSVIPLTNIHKAMFNLGFPASGFVISKCSVDSGGLNITALKRNVSTDYISFPTEASPYSIIINATDGKTDISVPSQRISGKIPVIDALTILKGLKGSTMDLDKYPFFESGYLVLKSHDSINYMEINAFVIEFINHLSAMLDA